MNEILKNNQLSVPVEKRLYELQRSLAELKQQEETLKEAILYSMEKYGIDKIENDLFTINYFPESETVRVDNKKLQKEHEEVYLGCLKKSKRKSFIKIKLNLNQ